MLKALMPSRPKAAGLALPAGDGGVLPPADAPPIREGEEGAQSDAAENDDREPASELDLLESVPTAEHDGELDAPRWRRIATTPGTARPC